MCREFSKNYPRKSELNPQAWALLHVADEKAAQEPQDGWVVDLACAHRGSLPPGLACSATQLYCYVTRACMVISLNLGSLVDKRPDLVHIWSCCNEQSIENVCRILSNGLEHRDQSMASSSPSFSLIKEEEMQAALIPWTTSWHCSWPHKFFHLGSSSNAFYYFFNLYFPWHAIILEWSHSLGTYTRYPCPYFIIGKGLIISLCVSDGFSFCTYLRSSS